MTGGSLKRSFLLKGKKTAVATVSLTPKRFLEMLLSFQMGVRLGDNKEASSDPNEKIIHIVVSKVVESCLECVLSGKV